MAKKSKGSASPYTNPDYGTPEYQAKDDADTLTKAQEIQSDKGRHKAATEHLEKRAAIAKDAHGNARKQLETKTKGRLKKAFGGAGAKGGTVQGEQDKEQGGMQKVVNEDD